MAQTIGSLDLNAFSDLHSDLTQYFWFESNASATYGAGAHVTLVPDTSFISNPTGQNILMNTDGFSIRNGLLPMMTLDNDSLDFNVVNTTAGTYVPTATFTSTSAQIGQSSGTHLELNTGGLSILNGALPMMTLDNGSLNFNVVDTTAGTYKTTATFTATGAQIGQTEKTHVNVYSNSLELTDSARTTFFKVRDAVNESGQVTDTFAGDGSTTQFTLSYTASNTTYTVTQNGTTVSPTKTRTNITFSTAPAVGDIIVVVYNVNGNSAKAYDLGMRKPNTISGDYSVIEGYDTTASGTYSYAGGCETIASGSYSHAEGYETKASGLSSHAEGYGTTANGLCSHAEGYYTIASESYSHAEGRNTQAIQYAAHVEGINTIASGFAAHAEGDNTEARGDYSHAAGIGTISMKGQTVIGMYNIMEGDEDDIPDPRVPVFIIGNGTSNATEDRSNALTVDWDGNIEIAGTFIDGCGHRHTLGLGAFYGSTSVAVASSNISATKTWYYGSSFNTWTYQHPILDTDYFTADHNGFKTKKKGIYRLQAEGHIQTASGVCPCAIRFYNYTKGTGFGPDRYSYSGTSWCGVYHHYVVEIAAGDTITVQVQKYDGTSGAKWKLTNLNFSMELIRELDE